MKTISPALLVAILFAGPLNADEKPRIDIGEREIEITGKYLLVPVSKKITPLV